MIADTYTGRYACIPCCDFCKYYRDAGGGPEKRGGFAGHGRCDLHNLEVMASSGCAAFDCAICNSEEE